MMSEADVQILQSGTENDLDAMLKRFNAAVSWICFIDFWFIFIDLLISETNIPCLRLLDVSFETAPLLNEDSNKTKSSNRLPISDVREARSIIPCLIQSFTLRKSNWNGIELKMVTLDNGIGQIYPISPRPEPHFTVWFISSIISS